MEYNKNTLQQVKEAIKDYMLHRFPAKTIAHVVPNFQTIAESQQVAAASLALANDREHYIRKGIHELVDEQFLLIKKRGELHSFQGGEKALDSMFSKMNRNDVTSSAEVDYAYLPSHLGFGTDVDSSLIWADYDPDDQ
ncbi:Uncharacterised protein [uncultured archaeon]|nr:Uncharacterised protein [uncultured archaeon]